MKDGGAAFPSVGEGYGDPKYWTPGMSLRDWFAGMALAGILPSQDDRGRSAFTECLPHEVATWAYQQADAMLKAGGHDG